MSYREVIKTVQGRATVDGAGVHLVRVLGVKTAEDYDPWLMLDSFDSKDPSLYEAGFPFHPHRGIETITYLIEGEMIHRDSLGNQGTVKSGESQWMTAGSGIMHEEMPQPSPRMLGAQIWLNLPKAEKMTAPNYFDIKKEMIPVVEEKDATVRVIAGDYKGIMGVDPPHIKATLYDVELGRGGLIEIGGKPDETCFIFLILGGATTGGRDIPEKTAVLYGPGDRIVVEAKREPTRFLYFQAPPLKEPIAWGGPIVMNTQSELREAFEELDNDTFVKHERP
ncbi:MAG: pirin family protein [Deltaproteobacteria bacterium]|jgi:redox-sensitive bicupin YhaK (pirin superfamily)|nr:pirin family protein [Deltaproteobacteria bacterium]